MDNFDLERHWFITNIVRPFVSIALLTVVFGFLIVGLARFFN
jgi:hypothetical protein